MCCFYRFYFLLRLVFGISMCIALQCDLYCVYIGHKTCAWLQQNARINIIYFIDLLLYLTNIYCLLSRSLCLRIYVYFTSNCYYRFSNFERFISLPLSFHFVFIFVSIYFACISHNLHENRNNNIKRYH